MNLSIEKINFGMSINIPGLSVYPRHSKNRSIFRNSETRPHKRFSATRTAQSKCTGCLEKEMLGHINQGTCSDVRMISCGYLPRSEKFESCRETERGKKNEKYVDHIGAGKRNGFRLILAELFFFPFFSVVDGCLWRFFFSICMCDFEVLS